MSSNSLDNGMFGIELTSQFVGHLIYFISRNFQVLRNQKKNL